MDQNSRNLNFLHAFIIFCVAILAGFSFFLYRDLNDLKAGIESINGNLGVALNQDTQVLESDCGEICKAEIQKAVSESIATISAAPKAKAAPTASSSTKNVSYLNLNGTFSTASINWTDITSTDIWIDSDHEYGKDAYIDWEAFVRTVSVNSKVFVRLYDVTHSIAVNGSEFESNSTTSARLSSGRLYLWSGHNLYRVQIKSLNGLDATFDGGRIKVVY